MLRPRHYRLVQEADLNQMTPVPHVEVGRVPGTSGGVVLDVLSAADALTDLPGTVLGISVPELPAAIRKHVAEAVFTGSDGRVQRTKVASVPKGVTITETDLVPHEWA